MISPEQYIQLVDFLEGRMSDTEKADFERQLAVDKELREELTWEKILRDKDDMSEEVKKILKKDPPVVQLQPVKPLVNLPWLAAASVIAIIVLGIGFLILNRQPANDRIVINKKPYIPKPHVDTLPVTTRPFDYQLAYKDYYKKLQTGTDLPEGLGNVELAYQQSDYRRVIDEARNISGTRGQESVSKNTSAYASFFEGLAQLELNQPARAVVSFNRAIAFSSDIYFQDDVSWYKALALLKQNKIDECKAILRSLNTRKAIRTKAQELMKKLETVK